MRHGKVGLRLGSNQKYYISRYEDGQTRGVQLTITTAGDDVDSLQERWGLIQFVDQQLNKIIEVFMPAEKKPLQYIPCPHCTNIHILFDMIGTSICCPFNDDKEVPINYYTDIIPADKSGESIIKSHIVSKVSQNNTLKVMPQFCFICFKIIQFLEQSFM